MQSKTREKQSHCNLSADQSQKSFAFLEFLSECFPGVRAGARAAVMPGAVNRAESWSAKEQSAVACADDLPENGRFWLLGGFHGQRESERADDAGEGRISDARIGQNLIERPEFEARCASDFPRSFRFDGVGERDHHLCQIAAFEGVSEVIEDGFVVGQALGRVPWLRFSMVENEKARETVRMLAGIASCRWCQRNALSSLNSHAGRSRLPLSTRQISTWSSRSM